MVYVVLSGGSMMSWVHWNINDPSLKNKLDNPVNDKTSGKQNKRTGVKCI